MPLTEAQRKRIPLTGFVFPKGSKKFDLPPRSYPINTRKRAQNALSLAALANVTKYRESATGKALVDKVYSAVIRKYPDLANSQSQTMKAYKRRNGRKNPKRSARTRLLQGRGKYEVFFESGGHTGPFRTLKAAKDYATRYAMNMNHDTAYVVKQEDMLKRNPIQYQIFYARGSRANPGHRMTKADFDAMFKSEVMPSIWEREASTTGQWRRADGPLRYQTYNDMVDGYVKDGLLPDRAYDWSHPRWLDTLRPKRPRRNSPEDLREIASQLEAASKMHGGQAARLKNLAKRGNPKARPDVLEGFRLPTKPTRKQIQNLIVKAEFGSEGRMVGGAHVGYFEPLPDDEFTPFLYALTQHYNLRGLSKHKNNPRVLMDALYDLGFRNTKQTPAYKKRMKAEKAKRREYLKRMRGRTLKRGNPYGHDLSDMATDVYISLDSDRPFAQRKSDIEKNLRRKIARGQFDPKLAEKAYRHVIDAYSKSYAREFNMSPWHRFITVDDRNQVAYAYVTDFMMAEGIDETKRSNPITLSDGDIIRHQARHLVKYNNQLNDVETFDAATRKRIQRQYRAIIEEFGGVPYSMAAAQPERKFSQLARKRRANPTEAQARSRYRGDTRLIGRLDAEDGKAPYLRALEDANYMEGYLTALRNRRSLTAVQKSFVKTGRTTPYIRDFSGPGGTEIKQSKASRDHAKLMVQAFALKAKTGSRIKAQTIINDPAACIRRMKRKK